MQTAYDSTAAKRPANLSINSDLLRQAKELDINLSQTLEQVLADRVREKRAECWRRDNRKAIADYNADVERNGVFGDGLRSF
ncbi:type II toxin-antitoxin system CcdA family antitoxin [Methylomagnum sp.]